MCFVLRQSLTCSLGCSWAHSVDQVGFELRDLPASTSPMLALRVCHPSFISVAVIKILRQNKFNGERIYPIYNSRSQSSVSRKSRPELEVASHRPSQGKRMNSWEWAQASLVLDYLIFHSAEPQTRNWHCVSPQPRQPRQPHRLALSRQFQAEMSSQAILGCFKLTVKTTTWHFFYPFHSAPTHFTLLVKLRWVLEFVVAHQSYFGFFVVWSRPLGHLNLRALSPHLQIITLVSIYSIGIHP